jgi:hypothetical protein
MLGTILVVFAFVLSLLASFVWPGVPSTGPVWGRVHLGWLALAFYFASLLFGHLMGAAIR